MNKNPLFNLVEKRKNGIFCGIPSFCSANKLVIEAILEQSKRFDDDVVIEATSNQVNQFGGYFHMTPLEFKDYVFHIADKIKFDKSHIILGGDHLGPQPWQHLTEEEAMKNSKELVRQTVLAGYLKIHLDTSMRVADDNHHQKLSDEIIARRGAELMVECEKAFQELLKKNPNAIHPVFVIGSEVPIPGGSQDEEMLQITKPEDFERTLIAYKQQFKIYQIEELWKYIIAVVVQPGVEFGNNEYHKYNRLDAFSLCQKLKEYPDIVFEGHSTDFQSPESLKEMVEDGIAIIKVGPALTFAVRQAMFALSYIERELIDEDDQRSHYIEILEKEMIANPKDWDKYYKGSEKENFLSRKYSYSDRSRYYICNEAVENARRKLFENLRNIEIPMGLLMQYMPFQYIKVRDGKLSMDPRDLVKDSVVTIVEDYNFAVKRNYMVGSVFISQSI